MTGSARSRVTGTALGVALLTLGGCGSTPVTSPPTGVDGLTVPTPDPRPTDFVTEVDHPLLPLADAGTWTYEAPDGGEVEVEVLGAAEVGGVPVTTLSRVATDGAGRVVGERWSSYAQDVEGNVWSFGREVLSGPGESWLAGEDGAEAGLLVPAEPRTGDGWLQQRSGGLTTRVEVLETDARVDLAAEATSAAGALVTEDTQLGPDAEPAVTRTYAPGLGLVQVADAASGELLLELAARRD